MTSHKILCGDASQFQGDERDVIILNMVDSNRGTTPLRLTRDNKTWQRYNVAVSRARDQVWIVYSMDASKDLNEYTDESEPPNMMVRATGQC